MRRPPRLLPLLAAILVPALVLDAAGLAQTAPPLPDLPAKKPMGFKIVTNDPDAPEAKQTRWVAATGAITPDTPQVFERFLQGNALDDLTIYFDSPGGSIVGGIRLGDALRKANARVAIGRSTPVGPEPKSNDPKLPRHQLIPARGICFSSCAYAFLGGRTRLIPPMASYGLHMFWPGDQMEGMLSRKYAYAEIERAQRISANLAVYLQRIGADARLLQIASGVPPQGSIRRLSPREILQYRVAEIYLGAPAFVGSGQWGLALDQSYARISGDGQIKLPNGNDVAYTLEIGCAPTPGFTNVRFEMAPRAAPPEGKPLAFRRALLTAGDKSAVLAQSGKDIVAQPATFPRRVTENPHGWIGAAATIPSDVVAEAAMRDPANFAVRVEDGETSFNAPFAIGNLRRTYGEWLKACERIGRSGRTIP